MPHLVVTRQANYHAPYDYCTVRHLRQARVAVDYVRITLWDVSGNAHFFFRERSNLEIVTVVR